MERQKIEALVHQHIDKLTQISTKYEAKSLVFFGVNQEEVSLIKELVFNKFNEIETHLKSDRSLELKELRKSPNLVDDKISELRARYDNLEESEFVSEHIVDLIAAENDRIEHIPTDLKKLTENLELVEIDLESYFLGEKRLNELSKIVDYYRIREFYDNINKISLSDNEREYVCLQDISQKVRGAKYFFCYNIDLQSSNYNFEFLLHSLFKWDHIEWSTFCFAAKKNGIDAMASDSIKTELSFKRTQVE